MTDAIFGERFVSVRQSAWHRKGIVIDEPVPASEAIAIAGVDYGVRKEELFLADGTSSGYSAVIRDELDDDPERIFGVAKQYELVHITDIELDDIKWPLATAGAIRNGSEVFVTFDLGDREILGEDYNMYLSVLHPYSPGISWRVILTPVRVVCQNTMMLGEASARTTIAVSHTEGAKARIDTAMLIAKAEADEARALQRLEQMSKIQVSDDDFAKVIKRLYGASKPRNYITDPIAEDSFAEQAASAYQARLTKEAEIVQDISSLYDRFNEEHTEFAGTGYALYNVLVEYNDFFKGPRTSEDKVAEMAILGTRATNKRKAADLVLALN